MLEDSLLLKLRRTALVPKLRTSRILVLGCAKFEDRQLHMVLKGAAVQSVAQLHSRFGSSWP